MTVKLNNIIFEDGTTLPCALNLFIDDPAPGTIKSPSDFDHYVGDNAFAQLEHSFGTKAKSFKIESI
jgi:hypothetical protein